MSSPVYQEYWSILNTRKFEFCIRHLENSMEFCWNRKTFLNVQFILPSNMFWIKTKKLLNAIKSIIWWMNLELDEFNTKVLFLMTK